MSKALLLLLAAVLCGSLPAQDTEETARLLALFNSHPKADIAVELVKKYEGLHDRSDYPYYGYGHRRLPNEKLSYGMTEAEAEACSARIWRCVTGCSASMVRTRYSYPKFRITGVIQTKILSQLDFYYIEYQ